MNNTVPIKKPACSLKVQPNGDPKESRREKLNKPTRTCRKRYQGDEYLIGGSWFEEEGQ